MGRDTPSEPTDEALLARYAQGDAAAARILTARLLPRVLGYATRLLGNRFDAEDVAQDTMLRLWRMAPNWRNGDARVATWLYRVATNLCMDRHRARKRRFASSLDDGPDPADPAPSAENGMMESDRMKALARALADLPDRQRQAVVLRHIELMTNPQIAEILEIGVEAVESLTSRGKRALTLALSGKKAQLGYQDDE